MRYVLGARFSCMRRAAHSCRLTSHPCEPFPTASVQMASRWYSNAVISLISQRLAHARHADTDSPIFQLVEGFPDIQRLKTDVFRERVAYSNRMKERLAVARRQGTDAVRAIEAELGDVSSQESAVVIDLFLSYRAVKAWQAMIDLVARMSLPLAATVMVQEQLALALN